MFVKVEHPCLRGGDLRELHLDSAQEKETKSWLKKVKVAAETSWGLMCPESRTEGKLWSRDYVPVEEES